MIFEEIKDILAEQLDLDPETIELSSSLANDLGADSIDAIDIVMSLEDQYGIEVPDSVIENMKTVEDIVNFVEANITDWAKILGIKNKWAGEGQTYFFLT